MAASLPITETIYLPIYYQPGSSISHTQVSQIEESPPSWMDPIRLYIATGESPDFRSMAHKVHIQSARFSLVDGQLYKRSLGGPYLKCLTPEQGQYVLAELHEGIYGNHPERRTLDPSLARGRLLSRESISSICFLLRRLRKNYYWLPPIISVNG